MRLALGLRDARSGETLTAFITPAGGDIDESGKYAIKLLAGRAKAEGVALVIFANRDHPGGE